MQKPAYHEPARTLAHRIALCKRYTLMAARLPGLNTITRNYDAHSANAPPPTLLLLPLLRWTGWSFLAARGARKHARTHARTLVYGTGYACSYNEANLHVRASAFCVAVDPKVLGITKLMGNL